MKLYTYWKNFNSYHEEKLFECKVETCKEADKLFRDYTGYNSATSWISCQVREVVDANS